MAYAIVCSRATGLYQTNNLLFDAVTQPTWTHVGGDLAVYQCDFDHLAPNALQVCVDATQQTVYMRWPTGYGLNWTQILTAAQIKTMTANANPGTINWVEYNSYIPGHVYACWNFNITTGPIIFLRSVNYGVNWSYVVIYTGLYNYGPDCINASRIAGATSLYANGGVIYFTVRYGVAAPPYVLHSFDDGLTWAASNSTGASNARKLVYADPRNDSISYTAKQPDAITYNLGKNTAYGVGDYVEIDGADQAGLPLEASIWISPKNSDTIRIARNSRMYYSDDGWASWTVGAPWAIGEIRALDGMGSTLPPNLLLGKWAAGAPNLVWISNDNGATLINKSGLNANLPDGGGDSVPFTSGIAAQGVALYSPATGGMSMSTSTMSEFFDADMGTIWVQPDGPNTQCFPLICHSTDGFTEPLGDVTTRMCRGASGWSVSHRGQGVPNDATIDIEAYLTKTQMWLQKQAARRCAMPVYLHLSQCGNAGLFLNYDAGELGRNAVITNKAPAGTVRGKADGGDGAADPTTVTYSLTAEPITNKYWKLTETVRAVAEAEPLRDIAFCNAAQCLGPCGSAEYDCEDGVIAADHTAAAAADFWHTHDGWATGAAVTAPFAATIDVASTTCFYTDRDTVRIVAIRGTTEANATPIHYSDDTGVTWTTVAASGTNASLAAHGGALFSLDKDHVWHCSHVAATQAHIWFSGNGAVTWEEQDIPALGANEVLMCIHFRDANYGACVGGTTAASSVFLHTSDGGVHWAEKTGPAAVLLTAVNVIDSNRVWVTTEGGALYYSNDMGTTWVARALPVTPSALGDIVFKDEFMGACCGNYNTGGADYGIVYRTFNGGYDWEYFVNDTAFDGALENYGLDAVWICDWNQIYAVGEPVGAVGLIFELENAGPA